MAYAARIRSCRKLRSVYTSPAKPRAKEVELVLGVLCQLVYGNRCELCRLILRGIIEVAKRDHAATMLFSKLEVLNNALLKLAKRRRKLEHNLANLSVI